MKYSKCFLLALIVIFASCSKDDDSQIFSIETYDIHVVGNITPENFYFTKAMYWKNNIPALLDQSENESTATAVVVVNNDVYISGSLNHKACYWKNGNIIYLPEGTEAYDIKVVGSDVYAAGENNYVACYWKNGVKTSLAESQNESRAYAISVVGNDVYVAGTQSLGRSNYKFLALYWKNNEAVILDDYQGFAYDILSNDNDIYVAGDAYSNNYINDLSFAYWKNDTKIYVSLKDQNKIYTYGLTVVNSDVYVAGYINSYMINEAAYWKNGKTNLLFNASGSQMTDANDIEVVDNSVFVCGSEEAGNRRLKPKIWVNNKETFLSGDIKEGEALGICVIKK